MSKVNALQNSKMKFKFERNMRLLFFIAGLLAAVIRAQEVLVQQLSAGAFRRSRKQGRTVPRYYICGAGVWKKTQKIDQPVKCQSSYSYKLKSMRMNCYQGPPTIVYARINGISFNYCHYQNWLTRLNLKEQGNWQWQGMKMCPENMYVYGFKSKLSERDGLAGLVLQCRTMKAPDIHQVVVFEGQGSWTYKVLSSNPAVGFQAKYVQGYINGLSMQMTAFPWINTFSLKYTFPTNFNTSLLEIENQIIKNNEWTIMTKEIQISRGKNLSRIWKNNRGQLHGASIKSMFSQTLLLKKIKIPSLASSMFDFQRQQMRYEIIQGEREEKTESFSFGILETFNVGKQVKAANIPPCMSCVIRQTVQTTDADVPYSVQIGYTNGVVTQYQSIDGVYQGTTIGEVETSITYERIC